MRVASCLVVVRDGITRHSNVCTLRAVWSLNAYIIPQGQGARKHRETTAGVRCSSHVAPPLVFIISQKRNGCLELKRRRTPDLEVLDCPFSVAPLRRLRLQEGDD